MRGMGMTLGAVVLAGAALLASSSSLRATTIEIYPYLSQGESTDLVVSVDGKKQCAITIAKIEKDAHRKPACRFELPASASTLVVRGEYVNEHWETKKRHRNRGETSWRLIDFAPVGSRLNQPGKSYGERMADFIAAADAFALEHLGKEYGGYIKAGKPAGDAEIAAAEKRLGYALPADFVSMQRKVGALAIDDHGLMDVAQIADADTQMRKVWGTPEEAMQSSYSEKERANLRASTLLFTEVGDGYGGLRYRPPPTRTCGDQPFYEWISQEGGDDRLRHADGRCMNFAEAFRWVLDGFLLEQYADELDSEKDALLIDSSLGTQPMALRTGTERFGVSLGVRWQGPNGLWRSPDVP